MEVYTTIPTTSSFRRQQPPSASLSLPELSIKVCVNRTCSRQGSRSVLFTLTDLAPPHITVTSSGCLGRCGAGPNLIVLPHQTLIAHCATAANAAQLLAQLCGDAFDPRTNLEALALRKRAEVVLEENVMNVSVAESLLSQAIGMEPLGGMHFLHRSRSAARLAMGDHEGALADAEEAIRLAPRYPQAYICQGDVFLAMGDWDAAEGAYSRALTIDPSIRRSKSFKARVAKLQEKLAASNLPS